jgi:chromosomal replication initiation ATPase DnaA
VMVNTKSVFSHKTSLEEIQQIVDSRMKMFFIHDVPVSIMDDTRKRPIVIYRQVFCKIARLMGYSMTNIGKYISRDHATVIHSIKTVDNLIEAKDKEMMDCLNDIYLMMHQQQFQMHEKVL